MMCGLSNSQKCWGNLPVVRWKGLDKIFSRGVQHLRKRKWERKKKSFSKMDQWGVWMKIVWWNKNEYDYWTRGPSLVYVLQQRIGGSRIPKRTPPLLRIPSSCAAIGEEDAGVPPEEAGPETRPAVRRATEVLGRDEASRAPLPRRRGAELPSPPLPPPWLTRSVKVRGVHLLQPSFPSLPVVPSDSTPFPIIPFLYISSSLLLHYHDATSTLPRHSLNCNVVGHFSFADMNSPTSLPENPLICDPVSELSEWKCVWTFSNILRFIIE